MKWNTSYFTGIAYMFLEKERRQLLLICFLCFGSFSLTALWLSTTLLRGVGFEARQLSTLQAVVGFLSGTLGTWVISRYCERFSSKDVFLWLLLTTCGLSLLAATFFDATSTPLLLSLLLLVTLAPTFIFIALYPTIIERSQGNFSASAFTTSMTVINCAGIFGSSLAPHLFKWAPGPQVFLLQALALAACYLISSKPSISKLLSFPFTPKGHFGS